MTRKTRKEIIDETVDYYTKDVSRRALQADKNGEMLCKYMTHDGKKCAVGRCMVNPSEKMTGTADRYKRDDSYAPTVEDELRDEYKGHPIAFWVELQQLHDRPSYWDSQSLTALGVRVVDAIHEKWDEK